MSVILKNNVEGFLATAISASDTGLVLQAGNGANFPNPVAPDYFFATLVSSGGTVEVVRVTARSGDSMTVVRGQDGTTANSFAAGARVEMRVNAQSVIDTVYGITNYQGASAGNPVQRLDGSALQAGDFYFNTTADEVRFFNGTAWQSLTTGSIDVQNFAGTGSQTNFTLSTVPTGEDNTQVYVNGVYQQKNTYSISGTTLIFSVAPPLGATIEVVVIEAIAIGQTSSDLVSYQPAGVSAVPTTVREKLRETVSVKDFGAVGDGVADDHLAIRAACDTGLPVVFPKGIYNFGTYAAPQNLTLVHDRQTLFLQGSEVRFVGKGVINVQASDVTIDLQGGVLGQYIGYAEVAVQTVDGGNTITVVDASNLFEGQNVTSSWSTSGSVFPLGGPTSPTPRKIVSIVGNVVTLDSNMTSGDVLQPEVIFGDFTFGVFLQCFETNFVVKNGTLERMTGYYYHSPNGIDTLGIGFRGGDIYFQNIDFQGNGTDQFLIKMEQKLHFNNCRAIQQWDTAKTGVYFADSGSLYITDCQMALGNYDASITMNNIWQPVTGFGQGGEIVISNSTITGQTRFSSSSLGYQAVDSLYAIELIYQGAFERISISNTRMASYTRHFIGSTSTTQTKSTTLNSLRVDNCLIDGSFGYFIHSGSGNGINCPSINVSNTSFFQDKPYMFFYVAPINGATSVFVPSFDNCYFRFAGAMSGFAKFESQAFVSDSTFNMNGIPFQHRNGVAEIDNCLFRNNPTIQISPSFDANFYGELSRIVIDDADFPANPGAVFTALGGSSLSGAKLANARSVNGSVFYDVYKLGTAIRVSGLFNKANGIYTLRADDYYIPQGSTIKDMWLGTIERVTFNLATTLASAATSGSTSIVVASATGVAAGDLVNILLDDVLVDTRVVDGSYVSGTTIPLTVATSGGAASGNKVNFFRVAAL